MSPRTKEQNEQIRRQRIGQIVQAAAKAYFRTGGGFDIRDVAKQAGLGYGTVYHYYANRHLLLQDMLARGFERAEAETAAIAAAGGAVEAVGRLRMYCRAMLALWRREPCAYLVFKLASERFDALPDAHAETCRQRFRERLYEPLERLVEAARARGAAAGGAAAGRAAGKRQAATDERLAHMLAVLVGCCGLHHYDAADQFNAELAERLAMHAVLDAGE